MIIDLTLFVKSFSFCIRKSGLVSALCSAPAAAPSKVAPATANIFLWSETSFVCLMYFRWCENTFAFISAPAIVQLVYLRQEREGRSELCHCIGETVCSPSHFCTAKMHPACKKRDTFRSEKPRSHRSSPSRQTSFLYRRNRLFA